MEQFHMRNIDKGHDSVLVPAAKRGNVRAFEDLLRRHEQKIFSVAQRITNNREDAEDVVQETFHKAFLHLDSFQEKSQFSTWLTRIAMNEAFMLLRRRRGIHEVMPDNNDDGAKPTLEVFVDRAPNPEESCLQLERTELLARAIDCLGPRIRTAILLRDIEEKSVAEAAAILGTSRTAVKARVFQARRKLRRLIKPGPTWKMYAARSRQIPSCG
jgi:RNA polymerase sigma-70 factor (ECF subfamily)